jgi:hypothetical protein
MGIIWNRCPECNTILSTRTGGIITEYCPNKKCPKYDQTYHPPMYG